MESRKLIRPVIGLVLLALGAFLLVSLLTHDPSEGPFPDITSEIVSGNACGVAGAYVSAYALALLGGAAYLVAGLVAFAGLAAFKVRLFDLPFRLVGLALVALALLLGLAIIDAAPSSSARLYSAAPGCRAGVLGIVLAGWLYRGIGATGVFILVVLFGCLGLFLTAGAELAALGRRLVGLAIGLAAGRKRAASRHADVPEPVRPVVVGRGGVTKELMPLASKRVAPAVVEGTGDLAADLPVAEPEPREPEVVTRYTPAAGTGADDDVDLEMFSETGRLDDSEYVLPPIDLLNKIPPTEAAGEEAEISETWQTLERTLEEFGVSARVVRVMRGPVITMYELSLAKGTKVTRLKTLADDLAIALRAPSIRIVAPLPGKNTVGVEIPNGERELVGLRELMEGTLNKAKGQAIPLFLGKDTAGKPLMLDLAACPHLLVAGATGSGKSVAINAMLISILMTRKPEEVQLLLIDPKSVEFGYYARLPHLMCPVLSDMKKASSVLKWACKKMDERFSVLSRVGVRDLGSYNELGEEEIRRRLDPEGDAVLDDVPFHMPHIVIVVDEFGELMMVAAKEVENSVIRLSQKARAVGIHLICATQRPSADVITGLIKSNLPARIAFQVASKVGSRIILDRNGADLLLGRGDMLLLPPGTARLIRAQGAFVSEDEIERVVGFAEEQGGPQFRTELRDYHVRQEKSEFSDELYDEAVRIVVENQRGSVSLLQRRLSIGYTRAARLIDMMADAGVVGPYSGSQARRVLMSIDDWERVHAQT